MHSNRSDVRIPLVLIAFVLLASLAVAATTTLTGQVVYQNGSQVQNNSATNVLSLVVFFNDTTDGFELLAFNESNGTGYFSLTFTSFNTTFYGFKVIVSNASSPAPQVVYMMPPMEAGAEELEELFNNSNVTVYPATTIFLNATNGSVAINFSGGLFDQATDVGVEMFITPGSNGDLHFNRTISVLSSRNYTLIAMRHGSGSPGNYGRAPRTIHILDSNLTDLTERVNNQWVFEISMAENPLMVSGNVSIANTTPVSNVTYQAIWLYPKAGRWTVMFAGIMGENSPPFSQSHLYNPAGPPFTWQVNKTSVEAATGSYNISLSGSTLYDGLSYMIMVLACDPADTCTTGGSGSTYYGAFQNVTLTNSNLSFNLTLYPLAGRFTDGATVGGARPGSSDVNTSRFIVLLNNTLNEPVDQATSPIVVNFTNGSGNGRVDVTYLVRTNASGYLLYPVHQNTTMDIRLLDGRFAPVRKVLNSDENSTTLRLAPFRPEQSDGSVRIGTTLNFYNYTSACNIPDPPSTCQVASFSGDNFRPGQFNRRGERFNILVRDSGGTGLIFYFIGVDIFASGPPDAAFDDSSESESSGQRQRQTRVGSLAPPIFDYAFIGIPYDPSTVDESNLTALLSALYDEDWVSNWNSTANPNGTNVPDRFADYNQSFFNTTAGGVPCTNSTSSYCYQNSTNDTVWIRVPHFSGSDVVVQGTAISLAGSSPSGDNDEGNDRPLELEYEFLCPGNTLVGRAISRATPVGGVVLRLLDPYSFMVGEDQTTDSDGEASFVVSRSGEYRLVQPIKKTGYRRVGDLRITIDLCAAEEPEETLPVVEEPPVEAPEEPAAEPSAEEPMPEEEIPVEEPAPDEEPPVAEPEERPPVQPGPADEEPAQPSAEPPPTPGLDMGLIVGVVVAAIVVLGAIYFLVLAAPKK